MANQADNRHMPYDVVAELKRIERMSPAERDRHFARTNAQEAERQAEESRRRFEERYFGALGMPADMRGHHAATFRPTESQRAAWGVVRDWVERLEDSIAAGAGAWLVAPTGRGKTAMLCAALNAIPARLASGGVTGRLPRQVTARYVDWSDVQYESRRRDFDLDELVRQMVSADVLVWDELGSRPDGPRTADPIYYILNRRLQNRRATLFAMNAHPDALAELIGAQEARRVKSLVPSRFRFGWHGEEYGEGA